MKTYDSAFIIKT